MFSSYIKLGIASSFPVLLSIILYLINKYTAFGRMKPWVKQIVFGVLFGGLAIIGTEWGIPITGAQVNCRDGAVLTAGLLFGAPAGIIAGLIGGIERWIAVAWGVGSFTRIACSVSTILAGIYAAVLRKYMFEDKKPGWIISFAVGIVMEVVHLTMVFVTNINDVTKAMKVVMACTAPMLIANGLAVMFASMAISIIGKEKPDYTGEHTKISATIQRWLLIPVIISFLFTSLFVFKMQTSLSNEQRDTVMRSAISEVTQEIQDKCNRNFLQTAELVLYAVDNGEDLKETADYFGLCEISMADENGIVFKSSVDNYVGMDLGVAGKTMEFLNNVNMEYEYVGEFGTLGRGSLTEKKQAGILTDYGYLLVVCDHEHFKGYIDSQITEMVNNKKIGETGFMVVENADGEIVSISKGFDKNSVNVLTSTINKLTYDTTMTLGETGSEMYVMVNESEGYTIWSMYPVSEALKVRNIALYVNTFLEVMVFALLFFLIYTLVKSIVVKRMRRINDSLSKIASGNLEEIVDVRSNQEFASLSDDINSMVDTLKDNIREAEERIDKELEFAKNIQLSSLPKADNAYPNRKDFQIYACMDTAKEVGGDFYDFYMTHNKVMNFLIADVSGKGIPAAMFMMQAKTELKTLAETDLPVDEVFTKGNNNLCEVNDAGMFVTAWQGHYDFRNGIIDFVNAGHNPPLVKRKDGKFEYLKSKVGLVLAGMDGIVYKKQEMPFGEGDVIFLYTDGVTEATNSSNELFGEDRLIDVLNEREYQDMKEICDTVKIRVDEFVGEAPQFDDITMLAFTYLGDKDMVYREFEATDEELNNVIGFIEEELEKIECPMKYVSQITVAAEEIFVNIAHYAYGKGKGNMKLGMNTIGGEVELKFIDNGMPFDPLKKVDPDITLSAEERSIGGLGIYMVKKTMDEVYYKYENSQNIFVIKKKIVQ